MLECYFERLCISLSLVRPVSSHLSSLRYLCCNHKLEP